MWLEFSRSLTSLNFNCKLDIPVFHGFQFDVWSYVSQMEEKVKEIVEIKQRSLAEESQKTLEVLKERYLLVCYCKLFVYSVYT